MAEPVRSCAEHAELLATAGAVIAEARSSIDRGDLRLGKAKLDSLLGAAAELPDVSELKQRLEERCALEAKRAVAGELRSADAAFDRLAACARPLEVVLQSMKAAGQACGCANEFEARECEELRQEAKLDLRSPRLVIAQLNADQIKLGEFNFETQQFPIQIEGQLIEQRFEQRCEPKMPAECAHLVLNGIVESDDNRMRFVGPAGDKKPAWRGTTVMFDLDSARKLKNRASELSATVVMVISDLAVRAVVKPEAEEARRQGLSQIAAAKRQKSNASAEARAEIREMEECVRISIMTYQEVTARASVVSVVGRSPLNGSVLVEDPEARDDALSK